MFVGAVCCLMLCVLYVVRCVLLSAVVCLLAIQCRFVAVCSYVRCVVWLLCVVRCLWIGARGRLLFAACCSSIVV